MAQDRLDQLDYYTLLGLPRDATADRIRDAFHRFALRYHPDQHVEGPPERVARAAEIYRRGAEAYRVLLEPSTRREYDAGLEQGRLRHHPQEQGPSQRPPTAARGRASQLPVQNARARPFAQKALQAIRVRDWRTAILNLQLALQHDPGNALIEARLAEVEGSFKKKGSKNRSR